MTGTRTPLPERRDGRPVCGHPMARSGNPCNLPGGHDGRHRLVRLAPVVPGEDKRTIPVTVMFSPAALHAITGTAGSAYRRWIADAAEDKLAATTGFRRTVVQRRRPASVPAAQPGGKLNAGDVKEVRVRVLMAPRAIEAIKAVAGDGTVSRWIADAAEEKAGHVDTARRPARRRRNRTEEET